MGIQILKSTKRGPPAIMSNKLRPKFFLFAAEPHGFVVPEVQFPSPPPRVVAALPPLFPVWACLLSVTPHVVDLNTSTPTSAGCSRVPCGLVGYSTPRSLGCRKDHGDSSPYSSAYLRSDAGDPKWWPPYSWCPSAASSCRRACRSSCPPVQPCSSLATHGFRLHG